MFCRLQSKAYAGRAPTDNGVQTRLTVRAQPLESLTALSVPCYCCVLSCARYSLTHFATVRIE